MIRVLVVEDENMLRRGLIATMPWADCGCVVVGEAANGADALKLVASLQPDLLVTDIRMPGMTGLELIRQSREIAPIEAIILSGYDEFEYAKTAILLGVSGYLLKPIDDDEFVAILRKTAENIRRLRRYRDMASDADNDAQTTYPTHLRGALNYIDEHYAQDITLRHVADAIYISDSYLSKLFRTHLNTSFLEYLTRVRVTRAEKLLRHGGHRIYEIAQMVGYRDVRYFYAVFKKAYGVTPREYQHQNNRSETN